MKLDLPSIEQRIARRIEPSNGGLKNPEFTYRSGCDIAGRHTKFTSVGGQVVARRVQRILVDEVPVLRKDQS